MLRAATVARRGHRYSLLRPRVACGASCSDERSSLNDETPRFSLLGGFSRASTPLLSSTFPPIDLSLSRRTFFSRSKSSDVDDKPTDTAQTPSFEQTMDKLFQEEPATTSDAADASIDAASQLVGEVWDPNWYNLADQAVNLINEVHSMTGWSYAASIIGITVCMRIMLTPLFIKSQQNAARMAHMQPEMLALRAKIDRLGSNIDQETQMKYGLQMRALFKKYNANPLKSLWLPLFQMPLFMSMFFGLRKMPMYFPEELVNGGIFWFPDLTLADPLYILPIGSSLTFLVMIELGKDQMMATNPAQGRIFVNVFRSMAIVMIPVATQFSSAVLCYWMTNNTISLLQSAVLRNPTVRKKLDIWEPPKPVPGVAQPKNILETVKETVDKAQGKHVTEEAKIRAHNEAIENKKRVAAVGKSGRAKRREAFKTGMKGRRK